MLISLLVSLGTGGLAAFFIRNSMQLYEHITQPFLAPPSWVFPVVWTVLFLLMGISAYLVWVAPGDVQDKQTALTIFAIQLALNFLWSIVFFRFEAYLGAFVLLIVLWLFIILMIFSFKRVSKSAAYLQIPYLLWVTFAGYLNFAIWLLNH